MRVYKPLFATEEPSDDGWEAELNGESEVAYPDALVDRSIFLWQPHPEKAFQFERIGFFTMDKDSVVPASISAYTDAAAGMGRDKGGGVVVLDPSTPGDADVAAMEAAAAAWEGCHLVANLTVNLKDSKPKKDGQGGAGRSRKEEQAKQLADKLARMSVAPEMMFRNQPELYSGAARLTYLSVHYHPPPPPSLTPTAPHTHYSLPLPARPALRARPPHAAFDAEGIPSHDAEGKEVSKSSQKKLKKEWEKQKKLYDGAQVK